MIKEGINVFFFLFQDKPKKNIKGNNIEFYGL